VGQYKKFPGLIGWYYTWRNDVLCHSSWKHMVNFCQFFLYFHSVFHNNFLLYPSGITMSSEGNQSSVPTFILLGFSEYPELQLPLFLVFLSTYTVTVVGNLGMIFIIQINPKLHTIMYFYLYN
jgi:hypothetical protein